MYLPVSGFSPITRIRACLPRKSLTAGDRAGPCSERYAASSTMGIVKVNPGPRSPSPLLTDKRPPCAATTPLEIAMPSSPVPSSLPAILSSTLEGPSNRCRRWGAVELALWMSTVTATCKSLGNAVILTVDDLDE